MLFSNDTLVNGLPLWGVFVDLDEFVVEHPSWHVSFFESWFEGVSTEDVPVEHQSLVSEMMTDFETFFAFVEKSVQSEAGISNGVVLLGYHVSEAQPDVLPDIAFVAAVAPDADVKVSRDFSQDFVFTDDVSFAIDFFGFLNKEITVSDSIKAANETVARNSDSLFNNIRDHVWLHHSFKGYVLDVTSLCLLQDPVDVARFVDVHANRRKSIFADKAAQYLKVSSKDLSDKANEFRFFASPLLGTVPYRDLRDTVETILS